jgi:hypothetical protein
MAGGPSSGEFSKQVLANTLGSLLAGAILYVLATIAGLIPVRPWLLATAVVGTVVVLGLILFGGAIAILMLYRVADERVERRYAARQAWLQTPEGKAYARAERQAQLQAAREAQQEWRRIIRERGLDQPAAGSL